MPSAERLDHGAIGNGRVIALVAPDSGIEWLCMPRFDAPSVFAAILDPARGGVFRFRVGGEIRAGRSAYVPNTNVLRTELDTGGGTVEILDFAPRVPLGGGRVNAPAEIIRVVRPLAGEPRIGIEFAPAPDYARTPGRVVVTTHGVEVLDAGAPLHLHSNVAGDLIARGAEVPVRHPLFFVLAHGNRATLPTMSEVDYLLHETIVGWRMWSKMCALPSFASAEVLRSALCLKLHAYNDTGAIIAAATTSIPEAIGTERCWDYRYCWLRDAAFVVEALRRLSHLNEGEQFIGFLRDVAESGPLQPLYGLAGERTLTEMTLDHLSGFANTRPVRIGNAAAAQRQNDLNGEILLCLHTLLGDPRIVLEQPRGFWPLVERLVEDAITLAPQPDTSIWEFRTLPRHYTFSRAMCWAAIDRGARIATSFGQTEQAVRWRAIADAEQQVVLSRGYNAQLGMFAQALDGSEGDAANLLLPTIGIIDARDPRFQSTLDAYARTMTADGLIKRYTNTDDFGDTTSAFTGCSFWWAEALALAGRIDEAIEVFRRVVAHANPLGLFSEDIEPGTGQLLGNFPQAYTHVGLVHAAMTIGVLCDARDGRVRAWA